MSTPTDALQRLRRVHEDAVLSALRSAGALSRAQLTERTGLSRTTMFAIVSGLLDLTATPFDRQGYANRPTDQRVDDILGELGLLALDLRGGPFEGRAGAANEQHDAGRGLLVGIELVADKATRKPMDRSVSGGIVAAFAAYAAALIVPVSLMFRQLGPIAGVLFAIAAGV